MELTALLEATFSFDEQCDGVGWALGDSVETLLLKYFNTIYTVQRLTLQGTEIRDVYHHSVNTRISVLNGENKKEIHIEENFM